MSRPFQPSGMRGAERARTLPSASSADDVVGQVDRSCRPSSSRRHVLDLVGLAAASRRSGALGGEEREAHRRRRSRARRRCSSSASITPSLSLTFAPPSTATNGRLGCVEQAEQHLDLLGEQPAGGRRQHARRTDDRRVRRGARRRTRRRRTRRRPSTRLADERRVVGLLAGVEAQVLEQLDARAPARPSRARDRRHRVASGSGSPFGRPRWLHVDDVRRRARCSHSIVGSAARMRKSSVIAAVRRSGHVEVGAQQHPLAVRPAARSSRLRVIRRLTSWLAAPDDAATRSTRRFE